MSKNSAKNDKTELASLESLLRQLPKKDLPAIAL